LFLMVCVRSRNRVEACATLLAARRAMGTPSGSGLGVSGRPLLELEAV
jgi:hypothetical protein